MMNKNIIIGIAEGMEKEAKEIEEKEQLIRKAFPSAGEEVLNSITAPLHATVEYLKKTAAQLRKMATAID
jgi:hypothetical protein